MYTFICISCKWHCPLKIKQNSLLAHSAVCLGRIWFVFVKWKGVYCVHLAYVLLKRWTLDFLGGGYYFICKPNWNWGVNYSGTKAFDFVPSKGLTKEILLLSCERQWTFARFGRPPPTPLSRADVQWVVLVRVPLWVDSLYKVWFNVKHEWVFDLVSRAEITAHSFVQPLH